MIRKTTLCVLVGLISISLAAENGNLQVAFLCNKPAVYLTSSGWIEDRSTDCLHEPQQILNFCKHVYPDKEITNVVESSHTVTIDNWCGFDSSKCHQHKRHTVRPFTCLVGTFQSEALLVPEHCVFDHRHGGKCFDYMHWNETAFEACWSQGMRTDSFSMLQPCLPDVDQFNGVEFVCCPVGNNNQVKSGPFIVEDDSDIFENDDVEAPSAAKPVDPNDIRSNHNSLDERPSQGPDTEYLNADNNDAYQEYVLRPRDGSKYANEHEYFLKAKASMQKFHHDRVSKMMSDWGSARQRVSEMKVVDPKGAEKFEKEVTDRFQRTYEALEQEGMEERRQLNAIHQQRVQFDLNNKKRDAMEKYMDVLTDPSSDINDVTKALRHYIKTEEKDRQRSLNHFRHMQQELDLNDENVVGEEETIREQALDHMQIVDQRIQQAIDMLSRVPEYESQIRKEIAEYLDTFSELDKQVVLTLNTPQAPVVPVESEQAQVFEQEEALKPLERVEKVEVAVAASSSEESSEEEEPIDLLHRVELEREEPHGWGMDVEFDDETMENERDIDGLPEMMQHPSALQADNLNRMQHQKMSFQKSEITKSRIAPVGGARANDMYSHGTTAVIAVAAVAVLAIIVVGAVLLRRRSSRARQGFMAVNQNVSPEEQHVSSMQMNGYENPTYRYFELNAKAAPASKA